MCVSSQCIVGNGKIESLLFLFLDRSSSATNRMQLPHQLRSGVLLPLKRQHTPPNFGCSYCKKVRYQKSRALGSIFPDSIFLSGPLQKLEKFDTAFQCQGRKYLGEQQQVEASRKHQGQGHHQIRAPLEQQHPFRERLEKKLRRVLQTLLTLW